jgi:hypothetical protein
MQRTAFTLSMLLFAATPSLAHDPDSGRPNWITFGDYKSPQTGVHCCGPNDCERLDTRTVQSTAGGFVLHAFDDELVPYSEATPSEDGQYWRCHTGHRWNPDGSPDKTTRRCFFAPVGSQ